MAIWKGSTNPILRGRKLTMVINQLQVLGSSSKYGPISSSGFGVDFGCLSHTHTFSTVGFGELRVDEAAKLPGKLRSQMETLFLFPLLELSGVKFLLVPSLLSIFYAFVAQFVFFLFTKIICSLVAEILRSLSLHQVWRPSGQGRSMP